MWNCLFSSFVPENLYHSILVQIFWYKWNPKSKSIMIHLLSLITKRSKRKTRIPFTEKTDLCTIHD